MTSEVEGRKKTSARSWKRRRSSPIAIPVRKEKGTGGMDSISVSRKGLKKGKRGRRRKRLSFPHPPK